MFRLWFGPTWFRVFTVHGILLFDLAFEFACDPHIFLVCYLFSCRYAKSARTFIVVDECIPIFVDVFVCEFRFPIPSRCLSWFLQISDSCLCHKAVLLLVFFLFVCSMCRISISACDDILWPCLHADRFQSLIFFGNHQPVAGWWLVQNVLRNSIWFVICWSVYTLSQERVVHTDKKAFSLCAWLAQCPFAVVPIDVTIIEVSDYHEAWIFFVLHRLLSFSIDFKMDSFFTVVVVGGL